MSAQRNRRQSNKQARARRHDGTQSEQFRCRSHCVRTGDAFHATVYLNAGQAISVRPGQRAEIKSTALPGATVPGQVLSVVPSTAARYKVTIAVTGAHAGLRHGLPVDVWITTRTKTDVLVVPNTAVIRCKDKFYVDVLERNGKRRRVQFTPGMIGRESTEVLDGLSEGQDLIINPKQ